MLYAMNCKARINAQDPDYPTYKAMDCMAHCNANENSYSRIMDCIATITSYIVTACRSWDQGIRLVVTIDGVNVSNSLIDSLSIRHDKNQVSDFSLSLGDIIYSPRTNSHIDLDKEVVITAYINGQEKKLFTGTLDEPSAENTPDFKVSITGRDYGKKLLDKKTTIVSVQDLADSTLRNHIIKYLAEQASVTAVDIPEMDAVTIDNSFTYQTIWDMIQKEAMVELYWIKFDEDGNLKLLLDEVKSDTDLYPTPDWTYDESRIVRLGYKKGRVEMNKIIVLGKTTSKRIPVTTSYDDTLVAHKDWAEGEATVWDEIVGDYHIVYTFGTDHSLYESGSMQITRVGSSHQSQIFFSTEGSFVFATKPYWNPTYQRWTISQTYRYKTAAGGDLKAGGVTITMRGATHSTTYETRYDQISAMVTDPNSIEKYCERDGGSVEYPLLETVEQCTAVGSKAIRDSHRLLGQTDIAIPFNPLIQTGQTIGITDNKIGITERYYIEKIEHNINFGDGKVDAETVIGGVLYV